MFAQTQNSVSEMEARLSAVEPDVSALRNHMMTVLYGLLSN